jgi:hypothetical protein
VLQIFESWAHQLSEEQWATFAKPYADEVPPDPGPCLGPYLDPYFSPYRILRSG